MAKKRANKRSIATIAEKALDKNRNQTMVYVVILTMVLASGIVTLRYLSATSSHYSKVINKEEKSLDALKVNAANAENLRRELDDAYGKQVNGSSVPVLSLDALPSVYDAPALSSSIYLLAARSNVKVTSLNNDDLSDSAPETSPSPTPLVMPFRISGNGKHDELVNFLELLDDSIRPFRVDRVEVVKSGDVKVEFKIEGQTYYQPKIKFEYKSEVVE